MDRINIRIDGISAIQALRLHEGGQQLSCPVCDAVLTTIPAGVAPGEGRIAGLLCPENSAHYLIYGEDADVMREARRRLNDIAAASGASRQKT